MSKNFELLQHVAREEELWPAAPTWRVRQHGWRRAARAHLNGAAQRISGILNGAFPALRRVDVMDGLRRVDLMDVMRRVDVMDVMRRGVEAWGWRLARPNDHRKDWEAIARDEETKLVQRVFPETDPNSPRVALFSGLESDAGCAAICVRTALMLAARATGSVCVVDADFRTPSLHDYYGVDNREGLAEAALEPRPVRDFARRLPGSNLLPASNLWFMPSGILAAGTSVPAVADRLRARIAELRGAFTYVLIHGTPLRRDTTGMLLSRWTDGVVLVMEANSTRRETALRVKENLSAAHVRVLGAILNNSTPPVPEALSRWL